MRSNPTEAERRLWLLLRNKRLAAYKFKRQQPIPPYFVCFDRRLIVEDDGSQHAESAYDEERDTWLKAQNFTVLRLWNNKILNDKEAVLDAILAALEGDGAASSHSIP